MTAPTIELQTEPVTRAAPPSQPTSLPIRARILLFKQRLIVTLRFWFRLPTDDMRDTALQHDLHGLLENQKVLEKMVDTQKQMLLELGSRLQYYEEKVPRLRDLKRQREGEVAQLRQHGIVGKIARC